jgi:hypothetical protein
MKTNLNRSITNVAEASAYIKELHDNNESYHPEDDAREVVWQTCTPTADECELLNKLMDDVYLYIDPCDVYMELITVNE